MTTLDYRGGAWASAVPLGIFVVLTVVLVLAGAPSTEGMILAAMVGLSIGMFFCRGAGRYSEAVFSLMSNRSATVAIVCWLWAGVFSGILRDSELVEAIVWVGWKLHLSGAAFTLGVFLSAALFAVSVGTGLGTVLGFTAVMYPAGIVLGGDPGLLMGAIFSGAALGDNLAPISDTTIVSATSQETDVGGVVTSRLKYVLIAGAISAALFYFLGGSGARLDPEVADTLLRQKASPRGLPMLLPGVLVFIVAVRGGHFLAALTAGIGSAIVLGPLTGVFELTDLVSVTADGQVAGSAVDGAMGLVPTSILTLLLVTAIGLLSTSGLLQLVMDWLDRTVAKGVRGAELAIVALISLANVCVSVNTVAMITVGPFANELRKRHGIHSYRAANLLDTISCSFPYLLPWAATITAGTALQRQVAETYPFVPVLEWSEQAPYIFYGMVLFPLMLLAVATGYGRRGDRERVRDGDG